MFQEKHSINSNRQRFAALSVPLANRFTTVSLKSAIRYQLQKFPFLSVLFLLPVSRSQLQMSPAMTELQFRILVYHRIPRRSYLYQIMFAFMAVKTILSRFRKSFSFIHCNYCHISGKGINKNSVLIDSFVNCDFVISLPLCFDRI